MTWSIRIAATVLVAWVIGGPPTAPSRAEGIAGKALQFDGIDDFARIPDNGSLSFPTGSFTIELWVRLDAGPAPGLLSSPLGKGAAINTCSSQHNYAFFVDSESGTPPNRVFFSYEPLGGCADFTDTIPSVLNVFDGQIPIGEWAHVAAVFEAGGGAGPDFFNAVSVYLNGVLGVRNENAPDAQQNSADIVLGNFFGNIWPMQGALDEVRIWDHARTGQQIADNYNRLVSPASAGLVGYWNFDEALDDQNIFDLAAAGGNSDGTLGAVLNDPQIPDPDDPLRVDSTAPLVPGFADCPADDGTLAQIFADAGAGATDSYLLAFQPGTSDSGFENNNGPAFCAGPFFPGDGTDPTVGFARPCSSISTDPDACFPTDPAQAREGRGMHGEQRIGVAGSSCTIQCYTIDGIRWCREVCVQSLGG